MASLKTALRPVRRTLTSPKLLRPLSTSTCFRASINNDDVHHNMINPSPDHELQVGELAGAKLKIEPIHREGEDEKTMRARLVYQSRKRGTLESDLLLSTFADEHLPRMSRAQMQQYDHFLDENDWDIYYWATQEEPLSHSASSSSPPPTDQPSSFAPSPRPENTPSGSVTGRSSWKPTSPFASGAQNPAVAAGAAGSEPYRKPGEGEWAQTIGTFKPAYRPVPARWRDSEILRLLREHVQKRSLGGAHGKGMGFMPPLRGGR